MGCGMSLRGVVRESPGGSSAVVKARSKAALSTLSAGSGTSPSKRPRATKQYLTETLLSLWPGFFESCKVSADEAISSGLLTPSDLLHDAGGSFSSSSTSSTAIAIASLAVADMILSQVESEGLVLEGRQTTQSQVDPKALQLYIELYTIKRRVAGMRLFDLACITLRRLLLSPDQNETWGEWVDTLMEATASEGDVELKQQLITVSKDICNIVRQFASASPSFTEGITDVMKGVAAHYIQRGAARRKPSPHFTASRPMGRLAIPSAVGRGSPGGSFLPPSPESIAPPEGFSPLMHTGDCMRWHFGRVVGLGGYGKVYVTWDPDHGCEMAVKEVDRGLEVGGRAERRVLKEISIMSGLRHPHIVPFLGTEMSDDGSSILIFMEFARDGNLGEHAQKQGGLDEAEAGWCLEQVTHGLAYLHGNRIIHRDIKGANCLLFQAALEGTSASLTYSAKSHGRLPRVRSVNGGSSFHKARPLVKLADFGASNTLAMLTTLTGENRTMQGTVNWMSPEVFMGKGVGRSTDVWSLGCLAIELLTGRPPWTPPEGPTLQQVTIMFKVAKTDDLPPFPTAISTQASSFISVCLQRSPNLRPAASQLSSHAWLAETGGGAVTDVAQPPLPSVPHTIKKVPEDFGNFMGRIGVGLLRGVGGGSGPGASSRAPSGGSDASVASQKKSGLHLESRPSSGRGDGPLHEDRHILPPPVQAGPAGSDGVCAG